MKSIFKTTLLLSLLTGLFIGTGYLLAGTGGALIAFGLAAVMNFGMYWFSSSLVLKMQKAKPLDESNNPEIVAIVRELAAADNLPMPKLYYVDTPIPNAFATGRSPKHAVVAVTTGITQILNRDELKAVLAHELGHVKNRDMLISTIAATVAGAITFLAEMAFWGGAIFGGNDEEGGNIVGTIAMIILAPLAATIIHFAISRNREFMADRHGAKLVGSGKDLASALYKLEQFKAEAGPIRPNRQQEASAHLMFMHMFSQAGLASLFSTHPTTKERVERLSRM